MDLGSVWIDHSGYVRVKVADGVWRLQHVLVMEEVIGRSLEKGEIVHHVNGIKTDNRRENLWLAANLGIHNAAHASFEALLGGLIADGVVEFDPISGRYLRAS